jgi:hypothetical protein
MNAALRLCDAPLILLIQDDWRLLEPLDLEAGADLLLAEPSIDLIRYSWPDRDDMRPTFTDYGNGFRRIDMQGRWAYGDDPHLRRRDFMERRGWYLEGGGHGSASGDMMARLVAGNATIVAADRCYFRHFGDVSSVLDEKRPRRVPR